MMHEQKRWIGGCRRKNAQKNLQLCLGNSNTERSGGSAGDPLKRSGNSRHAEERSSNHNWQSRVAPKGALHIRSSSKPLSLPYAPECVTYRVLSLVPRTLCHPSQILSLPLFQSPQHQNLTLTSSEQPRT